MVKKSLLIFLVALGLALAWQLRAPAFRIVFFDVGQGDSILIETPRGFQVLVDGGPSKTLLTRLGETLPFYDRALDLVVVTHFDRDHVGGLFYLLERYRIGKILIPRLYRESATAQRFLELATERKVAWERVGAESDFARDGVFFDFLTAPDNPSFSENEQSTVLQVAFKESRTLLLADATARLEELLLVQLWPTQVVKIAHHGSRTGTSPLLLQRVKPRVAVLSVGRNSYGHPHEEVLQRLQQAGIKALRTDSDGTIRLSLVKNKLKIVTSR